MPNLDDVYRKFGETSEAAQLLETELGNILLFVQGKKANLRLFSALVSEERYPIPMKSVDI